jgi:Mg2+-importing ATPase
VIFVIRTAKNPFRSRPSGPLLASCLAAVAVGIYLPFSPLAKMLGFAPLPLSYFAFVAVATLAYLFLVEIGKRILFREASRNSATRAA